MSNLRAEVFAFIQAYSVCTAATVLAHSVPAWETHAHRAMQNVGTRDGHGRSSVHYVMFNGRFRQQLRLHQVSAVAAI